MWQRGGIDALDACDFQKIHRAASFGVTADAVGVEKEALCGIGDGIEDLFGLIGGRRGSSEGCRGGDATALRA